MISRDKGTDTSLGYSENCLCEATHDPVFFDGAVHTGATKFCNLFSTRAYPFLPMGTLRFCRQIIAWYYRNKLQCSDVIFFANGIRHRYMAVSEAESVFEGK
ncbi:hypothetical protein AVEN_115650-1 [Araneus ventricosus]|uniref:Uncharacterized protein n=1 Tax=Araneus ventricosus TaxID=182803 RepID=A0A4Y2KZC4_ARAVE|nr:hypothetical protein AVEN_115650-1 [Araneus ventricosus]